MAYLDHAATTPLLPDVVEAMSHQLAEHGNPSSLHAAGRARRRVVEECRERIAGALGARPSDVVFTSGGTEADNLAVKGLYWARAAVDPRRRRVLVGAAEHHAVLDSAEWLARHQGAVVEFVPVDATGVVGAGALEEAIARDPESVALVSVMWANNEVGAISDVPALAAVAHRYGVPLHTDAVQAAGQLPVDFAASGADALTVTGHKLGGPIGAGALLLARGADVVPVLHGGGQERDVRSGTLDAPAILGFATAVELAVASRGDRVARLRGLRDELVAGALAAVPDAQLNGPALDGPRLPGNAHLSFPGCEGDSLLLLLDARGVECSTGSACNAGVARPSHVLLAMGTDEARARSSLRLTLGHCSTTSDVEAFATAIGPAVERARAAAAGQARDLETAAT